MTPYAILFTMAAIGIAETVYLIKKRKASERPVCPMGGGCSTVLESKYNSIFGVHNDVMGLLFYIGLTILTALVVIEVGAVGVLNTLVMVGVGSGFIFSLVLTYLQWKVIKAWCFWCLMSALTVTVMLITVLVAGFDMQWLF